MSEVNMAKAKETYALLCRMLDNGDWKYVKHEDDLVITATVTGQDLPIEFLMRVNPINEIVSFISFLPFKVDESKTVEIALATSMINYKLADGSFDFDLESGSVLFRLTSSYRNSVISEELLEYVLLISASTVDDYNDKLFMLAKGMLSIEQFIESMKD